MFSNFSLMFSNFSQMFSSITTFYTDEIHQNCFVKAYMKVMDGILVLGCVRLISNTYLIQASEEEGEDKGSAKDEEEEEVQIISFTSLNIDSFIIKLILVI